MAEVLEGVLSEAILDELASDLGCDPRLLRKHPFFRVLKGRVLLTYPLKRSLAAPQFYELEEEQINPAFGQFYDAVDYEGAGILYMANVMSDDVVQANVKALRITLDDDYTTGILDGASEATTDVWYLVDLKDAVLTKTAYPRHVIPFRKNLRVEYRTDQTLTVGKKIVCQVHLGKYP